MKYMYYEENYYATFEGIAFGNSLSEPVKATMKVREEDEYKNIVCCYDIRTQEMWVEGECKNADSLCVLVKKEFDDVFSDREKFEKLLLETLCKKEGIYLGYYMIPHYSLCYQQGLYDLAVPISACASMDAGRFDEFIRRSKNSELSWKYAATLNFVVMRDPSYLNKEFMIRRERGKRNGTNVAREFQRRAAIVLEKAEEHARAFKSLRESI